MHNITNGIPRPRLSPRIRGPSLACFAAPAVGAEVDAREADADVRVRVRVDVAEALELEDLIGAFVGLTPATAEDTEGVRPSALVALLQQFRLPLGEQQKSPGLTAEDPPSPHPTT